MVKVEPTLSSISIRWRRNRLWIGWLRGNVPFISDNSGIACSHTMKATHTEGSPQQLDLFDQPPTAATLAHSIIERSDWSSDMTHRLRVLLHVDPLIRLKQGDTRRDLELQHYDSLALAVRTMDLIVERMGFDEEINRERLIEELSGLLQKMDAAAGVPVDRERHERIVDRLLSHLRNDDDGRKPFVIEYFAVDATGVSERYQLTFRLLSDRFHPSGGTVLRLSDQAINLYLNALDLDVEDAQAAAEAVVRSQLERGKFHEASNAARGAMMNSVRYEQKIGQVLRETRRDVSQVDWREAIPKLLTEALNHIQRRLETEQGIIAVGRERLEDLPGHDDQALDAVQEVVRLVEQCRELHTALHVQVMQARSVFLDEQARQSFRPTRTLRHPELVNEVLLPILRASRRDAEQLVSQSAPAFFGAIPTGMCSLLNLIQWQLRPRRGWPEGTVTVETPDLAESEPDAIRFPPVLRQRLFQALSEEITGRIQLSALLQNPRVAPDQGVRELLAIASLGQFGRDAQDAPLFDVEPNGGRLDVAGFYGDDLDLLPFVDRTEEEGLPDAAVLSAPSRGR